MVTEPYNYERFRADTYGFEGFPGPEPGEQFPSFEAWTPEGDRVDREDLVGQPTVIETGSITCPIYTAHSPAMRRLRDRFESVRFVLLYVREAHPGNRIGPHATLAEKRQRARQLRSAEGEDRDVLVDGTDGRLHEEIGPFPNLVYVLDEDARVVYRSEWNDPSAVETVLEHLSQGDPVPWIEPDLGKPPASPWEVLRVIWRAGSKALWDLVKALPALLAKRNRLEGRWRVRSGDETQPPDGEETSQPGSPADDRDRAKP